MDTLLWVFIVAFAVAAGIALSLLLRRNPLQADLAQAREALAVSRERATALETTREELTRQVAEQRSAGQLLLEEKSRLTTSLEHVTLQLAKVSEALDEEHAKHQSSADLHARSAADLRVAQSELAGLRAAFGTERNGLQAQLQQQKLWIAEQTQHFENRVLAASAKLMEERGRAFTELNRKEVDAVVAPFKEQLENFRRRVDLIYDSENKDRGALKEQILQLTSLNQAVSREAQRLANALTVTSKSTGDWGETILSRILEDSGLREGKEYRLQHSVAGQEGERLQPDAVVFLPGDRQLIVDAKVSNKAWTEYCAAEDDEQRQSHLKDHLLSLRTHLKGLSGKDYSRSPELSTVDFVLMFVPVEGALLTAFAADGSLYTEAFQKKVILVTPSTLMAVIKLAEGLWTLQTRKESADQIAEMGRKLYEKLTNFAGTFLAVGNAIDQSQRAFEQARGQLSTGKGNAISLAQKMLDLGISPAAGKAMPAELLGSDDNL